MGQHMAAYPMSKTPSFSPVLTKSGWMISIPASMTGEGYRQRRFFADEDEAKKFSAGLRKKYREGQRGGVIPFELAVMAANAAEILEPHGVTILDAARAYVSRLDLVGSPETLQERYQSALLANEGRWSDRYKKDMDRLPRWVGRELMDMRVCDIQPADIANALRAHGAAAQSTIDMRSRYVSAILKHRPRHHRTSEIAIMSPRQCGQMLRACESPEERRAVALLLWAGIRPSAEDGEITRLDWSAVGPADIEIGADISKTGSGRHIPITPRLRRLIKGHPASGPVIPANWRRVYKRLRGAVEGIAGKQDITRHTFASNFLAGFDDKAAKQAMGHTEGSQTLFRHYRKAVTEADGLKFFR
jgi:hypothetical protein